MSSAASASCLVVGRDANSWVVETEMREELWKTKSGKTVAGLRVEVSVPTWKHVVLPGACQQWSPSRL